jgi:hypothetical protein
MADSIISVVRLAWVFRGRMDRARITAILETIVTLAPSCAPVYGPSRKYALADVGVDGIAAAAERAEGSAVFGVRAPVAEMRMSLGSDGLQAGCGFHQFGLMVHADAARGPRLGRELAQLLSGVAVASRSFYAEARLREVQRQGRTIVGPLPELPLDPLPFNGWAGIPVEPALAVAVGPPYAALWPELTEVGSPLLRRSQWWPMPCWMGQCAFRWLRQRSGKRLTLAGRRSRRAHCPRRVFAPTCRLLMPSIGHSPTMPTPRTDG